MSTPIVVRGDARALPLPDCSVDAVVCDPPYELSFMGRSWDSTGVAFDTEPWREALRVLKPGGHLAAFGATRTYHRLGCAIEDAGFEIRDSIRAGVYAWVHGQGFPKSLDVGKAIDKAGGGSPVEHGRVLRQARERSGLSRQDVVGAVGCTLTSLRDWEEGRSRAVGESPEVCTPSPVYRAKLADLLGYTADERRIAGVGRKAGPLHDYGHGEVLYGPAATGAARAWSGWGTALKPAWEPIVVARKPLDGTVAASVLAHGTGAINIDACRVGMSDADREIVDKRSGGENQQRDAVWQNGAGGRPPGERFTSAAGGRFPSNLLIAHHPVCGDGCHELCHVRAVDEQSGTLTSGTTKASHADNDGGRSGGIMGAHTARQRTRDWAGDTGGASRYFPTFRYEPKAPGWQRPQVDGRGFETVKPLDLMRWLVRLLTPPGGLVLDMFPGTGTTGQAAGLEGFRSLLVELEAAHIPFIRERLAQQVVVDRKTNEAVPVTPAPHDALSLFDLEAS